MIRAILFIVLFLPYFCWSQIQYLGSYDESNSGADIWEYVDPDTGKIYAIVGGYGISILDVTFPYAPFEVAYLEDAPGFDVKVWSHFIYGTTGGTGESAIIDIQDPLHPQTVGAFPAAHNVFIDERGIMYASEPGVTLYNLNPNPRQPIVLSQVGSEGHDVTVRGNLMLDCHGFSGSNIYDVTDPANPILLTHISDPQMTYHHQGDFSPDMNYVYICDELANHPQADITVWDISNLSNPVKVSEVADPTANAHNLYVRDEMAYVAYYTAGLKVFDISEPEELSLVDIYDTNEVIGEQFSGAFGVYPSTATEHIYVNDYFGVFILKIGDLGITKNFIRDITLSPNPASSVLNVFSENSEINHVQITSVLGEHLKEWSTPKGTTELKLDVTGWNARLIFVTVNGETTFKVFLE